MCPVWQASLPETQYPDVARNAAARVQQLTAVTRQLWVFKKEIGIGIVCDLFRRALAPILGGPGHAVKVFVVQLKVEPSAGW